MTSDVPDGAVVETAETTLVVRRSFDAPPEAVWVAWTDPDRVDVWWGPEGFSTATAEMNVSAGGVWRFEMVGPGGERYPNLVTYEAVDAPSHLVYTQGEPGDPEQFRVTVTFEEEAEDETALRMEMRFPSPADLDEAVEYGADEGATQTLGKLAEHLRGSDTADGGER